jgi:hypothetical protein
VLCGLTPGNIDSPRYVPLSLPDDKKGHIRQGAGAHAGAARARGPMVGDLMDPAGREAQVRRFVEEVWNGRNYEACSELYGEDYMNPFGKGPAAKASASASTIRRSLTTCASRSMI